MIKINTILKELNQEKVRLIIVEILNFMAIVGLATNIYLIGKVFTIYNLKTIIIIIILNLFFLSLIYIKNNILNNLTNTILENINKKIINKLEKLPLNYFKLNNDLVDNIYIITENLYDTLRNIISSINTVIIIMFSILIICPIMFVVIIILLYSGLIVLKHINKNIKLESFSLNQIMNYDISIRSNFKLKNENTYKKLVFNYPIIIFIKTLILILIISIGSILIINNKMNIGNIISLILYSFTLLYNDYLYIIKKAFRTYNAYIKISKMLNDKEQINRPIKHIAIDSIKGDIIFDNVVYGYDAKKPIINNINLSIKSGKKVALVGSGGKTLIKLLMRSYDVNYGNIFIDGHNIKDIDLNELKKVFRIVDKFDYNTNLYYEKKYNKKQLNLINEYIEIIKKSPFQDRGLLYTIGQAILDNPQILIFNDIDNYINDYKKILENLINTFLKKSTIIFKTNNYSTIEKVDMIILIKKGEIIKTGSHKELLKTNKYYKEYIYPNLK